MAGRPPKVGLDFVGWDVNVFFNDRKIDKLMDAQGCVGFVIYFYLCLMAYGSNGYYCSWCYDDAATTAKKIGGGAGAKSVEETVRYCLQLGLFDQGLFDRWNILTSRGIQKRYMQVALTRTNKTVISEYWLLNDEESAGLDFCTLNSNFPPKNANYDPKKSNLSGSKVKYSKVQYSNNEFDRFWQAYPRKVAKKDALKAWSALKVDEALADAIVKGVKEWSKTQQWRQNAGQYVPYPATFLRRAQWEEIPPAAGWSKDSAQDYSQDEDEYDRMVIERARANKDALMQYGRSE